MDNRAAAGPSPEPAGRAALGGTARLLWAAACPFPDPERIRRACEGEIDAHLVVAAAIEQGVGPLVWQSVSLSGCQEQLGDAAQALRANAAMWHARAHFLAGAVALAVDPLRQSGLEPVVLKGAALAERYPDPPLRPMGDIDLLLPSRDHAAALGALQRAGWTVALRIDRLRHETLLAHPDLPTLKLELHAGLDRWHNRLTHLDGTGLWRRRRRAKVLGTDAFILTPEDELLMLAAHAGKPFHSFDRLIWSADLVVVITAAEARDELDWELLRSRARDAGCSTVLAVALAHAMRLGADMPADLLAGLPRRGWRRLVLDPVLGLEWPLAKPDGALQHRARYALAESWPQRLLLLLGETPREPLHRQPVLIGRRAWTALSGLPRLQRQHR
ncbi:MAG TPA: nucleotidyltransferase family protein [Candidatus Solibacter sp.]|jgi:hypothetical protein|nr:nucleotidyltransferase family protein [Candidatus Solibacter sp.]